MTKQRAMTRGFVATAALAAALFAPVAADAGRYVPVSTLRAASCPAGYVEAQLSWGDKCLRSGEYCKVGNVQYRRYGFDCPASGHLTSSATRRAATPVAAVTLTLRRAVLLGRRSRTHACTRGPLPDRRCSPGAYMPRLTKTVLCSPGFRTGSIRDVPQSVKFAVEREYGLRPTLYGRTIEIDHIVSLELGGSNSIANLYPEPGRGAANYHVKDRLENRLHDMVCAGRIGLRTARRQIASNWRALYGRVFGARATN
jgi:hypothetical protein